jgi:hypothetical protein
MATPRAARTAFRTAGSRRDGCREGQHRTAQPRTDPSDGAIGGPEVVPPLADAVSLVHRDQGHLNLVQERQDCLQAQTLRRDEEDPHAPSANVDGNASPLVPTLCPAEEGRGQTDVPRTTHLVFHQGDQRSHDQREAR